MEKSSTYTNEQWIHTLEVMKNVEQQFLGISSASIVFFEVLQKVVSTEKNLRFAPISSIVTNRNGENVNNKSRTYANEQWIRISEGMDNVGQQFVGISSTSVVFFEALRKVAHKPGKSGRVERQRQGTTTEKIQRR